MNKFIENDIEVLGLNEKTNNILKDNSIFKIKDLWVLRRQDLKKIKLSDSDINHIIVHLQLKGYDLNKKTY